MGNPAEHDSCKMSNSAIAHVILVDVNYVDHFDAYGEEIPGSNSNAKWQNYRWGPSVKDNVAVKV